ncbi:MAG: YibE/F family protein, partial [Desulfovibrionales bacterium]|nr:YibE/F family protein [Desulfovibrionales bacterium]
FFLPTPHYGGAQSSLRCKGKILSVDNSQVHLLGMVRKGSQGVRLEVQSGPLAGRIFLAANQLMGQLDRDKLFEPGDMALVVISLDANDKVCYVLPQDHYRLGGQVLLFGIFAGGLLVFGGWTGVRSLFSFLISGLVIWKVLVPLFLKGIPPIPLAFFMVLGLCSLIIFLVAGFNAKGGTALCGAILGVLFSCGLSMVFTREFHLHGAIMPFAETLLYSGYGHLDMTGIYIAGVFICASGAVMDLAMDVAASMDEVRQKHPWIGMGELFFSGLRVSRAVVGTMTTTLLFAYSGGYITLLMAFMAQGIPVANMVNLIYVAAEVSKTLIGSIGLILVGPFTALTGAWVLLRPPISFHGKTDPAVFSR